MKFKTLNLSTQTLHIYSYMYFNVHARIEYCHDEGSPLSMLLEDINCMYRYTFSSALLIR